MGEEGLPAGANAQARLARNEGTQGLKAIVRYHACLIERTGEVEQT
jgi:hypothetical protein